MTSSINIDQSQGMFTDLLEHFAHVLPAQAPIRDFVHHNTLHGFEHLPFTEALAAAYELTGAYGYWPQATFREKYLQGRIDDIDIAWSLLQDESLEAGRLVFQAGDRKITKKDILKTCLLFPIENITTCQFNFQIDEARALENFQTDIPNPVRRKLLSLAKAYGQDNEATAIKELWTACTEVLKLDIESLHPEDLSNLSPQYATKMLDRLALDLKDDDSESKLEAIIRQEAWLKLESLSNSVGSKITLSTFLQQITGIDIQKDINAYLQPHLANWMDQGVAAWNAENRQIGFYQAWKQSALQDENWLFNELDDWKEHIDSLSNDPTETLISELSLMGIPQDKWAAYLERLALDLPGWSGMFYWRHCNPNYEGRSDVNVNMLDYLAVRLVTEHLYARRLCRKYWLIDANLSALKGQFHHQYSEFLVRYTLNQQRLPEYLIMLAQQLVERHTNQTNLEQEWQLLSHMVWTWRNSSRSDEQKGYVQHHEAWKLFRLSQHLGLCDSDIYPLDQKTLEDIFTCMHELDQQASGFILLQAYEHHYREEVFSAIAHNHGRGTWKDRDNHRPEAQIIFCMDDREEGVRRHLEFLNPKIETFGAAAFFGVVMNWQDLDAKDPVVLCPVVVTPVHEVAEVAARGHEQTIKEHKKRYQLRNNINDVIHQETRRNLLSSTALMSLNAPLALSRLIGKIFMPLTWGNIEKSLQAKFDKEKVTRITSTASQQREDRDTDNNQQGFTHDEQANIVEGFLQNNGLLSGFGQLVVLMGHYSSNQNNPHTAAYGCGACGGKYSGPNGRVFAAMANNPEVRNLLFQRNIKIPDDCWFIGAEHDTCNEEILWFDQDIIPKTLSAAFRKLQQDLGIATRHSAHERCRKLASAPRKPSLSRAIKHITSRAVDFSQPRPELGHATNAVGVIGRRYLTQGTFLDRRSFLISYDASVDPDGKFLERILLSAGPVGAGINLEYYFSGVNNDKFGCSSKIVHNLSGLFGVMEGTSSDLRTGLPQQMIEIHEPMRLQLMVEASMETLTAIYQRQAPIRQLVGNAWLLLTSKHPETGEINTFNPKKGWEPWQAKQETPRVNESVDWYAGHTDHLPPALIKRSA